MTAKEAGTTVGDFVRAGIGADPNVQRIAGTGAALVLSALSGAFTGLLAAALALLFLCDLALGVLKALHVGGLEQFDWPKFWRAWLKMGAAIVGIGLFAVGDMVLHEVGAPEEWRPLATVAIFGMCMGFFVSAVNSFTHFFPEVGNWIDRYIKHRLPPTDLDVRKETILMIRRTDAARAGEEPPTRRKSYDPEAVEIEKAIETPDGRTLYDVIHEDDPEPESGPDVPPAA